MNETKILNERPQCPHAKSCGGCQLQNMSYPRQLEWKQAKVVREIGKFCRVEPITAAAFAASPLTTFSS